MPKFGLPTPKCQRHFVRWPKKGSSKPGTLRQSQGSQRGTIDLLENTYETAAKRATDYNHKLIEIARTNTCGSTTSMNCWVRSHRRSFSSCRPRKCASNSRSCPGRITSCARFIRRWRPRPLGQSRPAKHLIRPADCAQGSGNFRPTTNSF